MCIRHFPAILLKNDFFLGGASSPRWRQTASSSLSSETSVPLTSNFRLFRLNCHNGGRQKGQAGDNNHGSGDIEGIG
jgi:hypothetical protein